MCLSSATAFAQNVNAQESAPEEGAIQSYTPAYFTTFAPQTAADMVARLPGFEIRGGGGGARGFGQASLNVLINGRRPSSKSSSANDILGRIPASNVTRIEIVDGSTLDVPGLSGQVANIVVKTGELSGSWNYGARFEQGSRPQLADGAINFSAKRGKLEAVGSLESGQFFFTEDGKETFFDEADNITQERNEKVGFINKRPSANLNLTLLRDNGDIANLNLSGSRRHRDVTLQEVFVDRTDPDLSGTSVAENGEVRDGFEISGDYSLDAPLLGRDGRLKFIALQRIDTLDRDNHFTFEDISSGQSRFLFERDDKATEFIARAEYTFQTGQSNDWSLALEGALNELNSETEAYEDEVSLSQEDVNVTEDRFQTSLSRSWSLDEHMNVQTSFGAEYSVISSDVRIFLGPDYLPLDTTREKASDSFFRPKGLANFSYTLDETWTLRAQIERSVGQLNFGTFVSGVDFASGQETSGGKIKPEQSWEADLEIQHQNSVGLSARAKLFYNIIEDPIVQIIFDQDGDEITQGPGNLDSNAEVFGIEGSVTWVLDDVLKGLRLTVDALVADSSIEDVVTLDDRPRSGQTLWEYDLEARWDIEGTPFAIEAEVEHSERDLRFRIDERTEDILRRPEVEFAVIHKDLFGMQWTAKVQNILDFELRRERLIFNGTRNGDLLQRESTRRQRGRRFSIEVTDTF